jgi:hypothetical protein
MSVFFKSSLVFRCMVARVLFFALPVSGYLDWFYLGLLWEVLLYAFTYMFMRMHVSPFVWVIPRNGILHWFNSWCFIPLYLVGQVHYLLLFQTDPSLPFFFFFLDIFQLNSLGKLTLSLIISLFICEIFRKLSPLIASKTLLVFSVKILNYVCTDPYLYIFSTIL